MYLLKDTALSPVEYMDLVLTTNDSITLTTLTNLLSNGQSKDAVTVPH